VIGFWQRKSEKWKVTPSPPVGKQLSGGGLSFSAGRFKQGSGSREQRNKWFSSRVSRTTPPLGSQARGHEVVPFEVDFYRVAINYLSILGSDGGLRSTPLPRPNPPRPLFRHRDGGPLPNSLGKLRRRRFLSSLFL